MREGLVFAGTLVAYALIHSLFSADRVKQRVANLLGPAFAGYRFAYVVFSTVLLIPLLWVPKPDGILYAVSAPLNLAFRTLQIAALAGFVWTLRHFDNGQFLGVTQLRTGLQSDRDEEGSFSATGPFRWCRHPLYLFSSLLLAANPVVTSTHAIFTLWAILYFYFGSFLEERRLLDAHGDAYANYREVTPRFIPSIRPSPRST